MIHLKKLILPSQSAEESFFSHQNYTCFHTPYPFLIFPEKELRTVEFDDITVFYGGNGSGKSTLINVMAHKLNSVRYSDFNGAPFFEDYVDRCSIEKGRTFKRSFVLTSDDVFDYVLNARSVNEHIDDHRQELFEKYAKIQEEARKNPSIGRLKNLDDYERWSEARHIISPKKSKSSYIKKYCEKDLNLHSNGETAMTFFLNKIDSEAVFFLDEPENSLSIEFQIDLAEYISNTVRATRSQFIIATHSPIFLSLENAKIYNLDSCPVSTCEWTDLPNVRKYFDFFMKHKNKFKTAKGKK